MACGCIPEFDGIVVRSGSEPTRVGGERDRVDGLGMACLNHYFGLRIRSGLIVIGSFRGAVSYSETAVLFLRLPGLTSDVYRLANQRQHDESYRHGSPRGDHLASNALHGYVEIVTRLKTDL